MGLVGRYFILTYDYPDDWESRRMPYRDEHMGLAQAWNADGRLLYAGVVGDPPRSALVVFAVEREQEVAEFVAADPYVREGIVAEHRISSWTIGSFER